MPLIHFIQVIPSLYPTLFLDVPVVQYIVTRWDGTTPMHSNMHKPVILMQVIMFHLLKLSTS